MKRQWCGWTIVVGALALVACSKSTVIERDGGGSVDV